MNKIISNSFMSEPDRRDISQKTESISSSIIDIVIVSFNTREYLENCLGILTESGGGVTSKVIVVDNASTDCSVDMVENNYSMVTLVKNPQNIGFAAAVNQGARLSNSPYLLLLNPDTIIPTHLKMALINFMGARPEIGALGCKMLNKDMTIQPSAFRRYPSLSTTLAGFLNIDNILRMLFPYWDFPGKYELSLNEYCNNQEVAHVTGACLMLRRSSLEAAGYFDERFFFSGEETDLQFRLRRLGYKVYLLNEVSVVHFGGGSSHNAPLKGRYLYIDGLKTFFMKHYGKFQTALILLINIFDEIVKVLAWLLAVPFVIIIKSDLYKGKINDHWMWLKVYYYIFIQVLYGRTRIQCS